MGWFTQDHNDHAALRAKKSAKKDMKQAPKGSAVRRERRQVYKMTRKEYNGFIKAAAKRGGGKIVEGGKITNKAAYLSVKEYAKRMRNGKCPCCGTAPDKGKDVCDQFNGPMNVETDLARHRESLETHTPSGKPIAGLTPGDPEWAVYFGRGGIRT
jgi:hypothetical protein